jgi:hypothetical protein
VAHAGDGGGSEDRAEGPPFLSEAEEALVMAFRRHTLLPFDDRLDSGLTPYEYIAKIWTLE